MKGLAHKSLQQNEMSLYRLHVGVCKVNKIGLIKKLRRAWNASSIYFKIKTGLVETVSIFSTNLKQAMQF